MKEVKVVECKECKYRDYCNRSITFTIDYEHTVVVDKRILSFCSKGEKEEN